MKHSEKNDPAWKLLGNARKVEVDPFFSRNVTREIRKLQADGGDREGVFEVIASWFRQPALAGTAAAFGVLLAVFLSTERAGKPVVVEVTPVSETETSPEFAEIEGIGYLGELMAVNDPDEFDDAELADLFILASR